MGKSLRDPNTRLLRRFVLLVTFAITLPSLLLSGFGLIAIENERDAAFQRMRETYSPVVFKLETHVRGELQAALAAAKQPLQGLIAWADRRGPMPASALRGLMQAHPALENFFVLGSNGALLWPVEDWPAPDVPELLPEELEQGLALEVEPGKTEAAAAHYRTLLQEFNGQPLGCFVSSALSLAIGQPHRDAEPCKGEKVLPPASRCLVRNGLARSLDRLGREGEAVEEWSRVAESCQGMVASPGYNLSLGARLRRLELLRPARVQARRGNHFLESSRPETIPGSNSTGQAALQEARLLARDLADPSTKASPGQRQYIGRRAAALLESSLDPEVRRVAGMLAGAGFADEVYKLSSKLSSAPGEELEIQSVAAGPRQHMLLLLRQGGQLAGVEVIAAELEPGLQKLLDELDIGSKLEATIRSTSEELPLSSHLRAVSLFLEVGKFAWRISLHLRGEEALSTLESGRSQLYLWVLILLVLVLVFGIAGTVVVVVRETRLSRLKTDFVSSVSHELRTPLTSIRLFTETLLMDRAGSDAERREFLEIIERESERLSRLVERILDFSRMEAGRRAYSFAPEPIPELVDLAVQACRSLIEERSAVLVFRLPEELPFVAVDRDAMVEVIINLLSNAIKYSPRGSEVTIRAERQPDGRVAIAVTDHGIGIPRAEQARIFEKFYRVETPLASEVSGSGLGLSLVKYIVAAHGGEVLVDSTPGQGSTFTVLLSPERVQNERAARTAG